METPEDPIQTEKKTPAEIEPSDTIDNETAREISDADDLPA
jgi:hypothetical protein